MAEQQQDTGGPQPTGPVPDQKEKDSRLWGTLCHLSALAGCVIPFAGCVVGPLVVWLLKREEFPFVDDQGKEAVNFQITMLIAGVVAFMSVFVLIGFVLLPAVGLFDLVMIVIASMKANEGERYRYPVSLRLIK